MTSRTPWRDGKARGEAIQAGVAAILRSRSLPGGDEMVNEWAPRLAGKVVEHAAPILEEAAASAERARCIRIALESARKLRDAADGTPRGQRRHVAADALEVLAEALREGGSG